MGQGALVLDTPSAIDNPFFLLAPHWSRIPMVLLATAATVIASQAVISGAFSITHQAVQLGYLPRLTIQHTSEEAAGQVYAPAVNWALCAAVAGLVVGFGSSADLAAAYGIAVAGTMTITTVLFCFMLRAGWKQPLAVTAAVGAALLSIDLALLSASLTKVPHGGWLPLSVALAVFTILTTWHTGHAAVIRNRIRQEGPLRAFVDEVRAADPPVFRAPGTAVFLHAERETTPLALRASFRHHHAVHESVVIVLLRTLNTPHVHPSRRVMVDDLGYRDDGITHVTARFGFRDRQDVPRTLALAAERGIERVSGADDPSYFLSRITLVRTGVRLMQPWRERLFVAMWRNQADASEYFALPDERTVIVGSLIEI
jgi:KUP system potassium uptake protein